MSPTHESVPKNEWPIFEATCTEDPDAFDPEGLPRGMIIILNEADFDAGGSHTEWIAAVPQVSIPIEEIEEVR